ncbi:MAG: response regulator, partial [Pseudomonadales bacterium]
LMNSRMVPFTRLTPRLERIVRQTANELNKSVELSIINADDEMDRTILERITSPLEHMLRNAVDHGIETTSTRLKSGKERSGRITLEVHREGSEIVIQLTDDGRGIDVEAVRSKAISQGLIDADDNSLSDLDIMQYIFNAGLSTSQQVTQISGRGVGMDVVISEIRQLGGSVSVVSELGKGSSFTMRLPLTVAVSDALVVRAADRYYAIPLVQIERVVRVNPEKLYDYYQSNDATLNFEDTEYRVRYLNEILSGNKLNELVVNTNTSLPLIIIKNRTGQNIALQVDQIAGSRIEVVVKPLGQQLSNIPGVSAATIMGDGSVMLILDLIALMRNAQLVKNITKAADAKRGRIESKSTILVVDDSVTVRKVTSRFLERQGFNVAVAKDGIDAIEILQDMTPDMILLDIEMPRMDGFEVATQVRHNSRLKQIPIIMITSRTGEKHRERALEIGVNDYMGKPFQEKELLDKMQKLLGEGVSLTNEG